MVSMPEDDAYYRMPLSTTVDVAGHQPVVSLRIWIVGTGWWDHDSHETGVTEVGRVQV